MKSLRINLVLLFILLLGAAIIGRLFFLQILNNDFYSALSQGQQKFFEQTIGERGKIFVHDQNNLLALAINKEISFAYISPEEIEEKESTAQQISEVLGLDKELVLNKVKKDSLYELVKKRITKEEENKLKDLNLEGVYIGNDKIREYPQNTFASHLLGYLGGNGIGQYGIEGYWNDVLTGKQGMIKGERGPNGFLFFKQKDIKGSDIVLTIDYNIQYQAEKLLKKAKKELDIESGQIIVIDPKTGKLIALANFPVFNPNFYEEYAKQGNLEIFQNGVIQKIFEPGSVFKAITMAIALDKGKITPQTTFIDKGFLKIGGYTIYNYGKRTYGKKTMTEVLENSINIGAVFAESQVGHKSFLNYMNKFGIFNKTGIDLQGEVSSENKEFKNGYEINFATASFGQGIEMTPMQLVRAFSVIANGGKLVKPYIVEKVIKNGEIFETKPQLSDNIISSQTSSKLTAMLVSVIENGYGKKAGVPGYWIGGKTGTAQVSFSAFGIKKSGYSNKTIQSFIGFAPAFDSKFLILVKLDNPKTKTAEYSAAPIFHNLAKYIIDLWQIPPDYE